MTSSAATPAIPETSSGRPGSPRPPGSRPWGQRVAVVLAAALLALVPGCRGCIRNPLAARREAAEDLLDQKGPPLPDFEIAGPAPLPASSFRPGSDAQEMAYKPGHWSTVHFEAKANHFDFFGELHLSATNGSGDPLPVPGTDFVLAGTRPALLSRGQPKILPTALFVPRSGEARTRADWRLVPLRGRRASVAASQPMAAMPSFQYHLVVLSPLADRYRYLDDLPAVHPPGFDLLGGLDRRHYRVVPVPIDRRPPLPESALYWTTIAYVVWDGADPNALALAQREALLDWLHWGGQLLISGPESLDILRGSFLEPFLPVSLAPGESIARTLSTADFEAVDRRFSLSAAGRSLAIDEAIGGVDLDLADEARWLPETGALLAERRVGRGRVVVSAFSLAARPLIVWPGYDNFFNACLLGRPPREYSPGRDGMVRPRWAGPARDADFFDARLTTNLRIFTRDGGTGSSGYARDVLADDPVVAAAFDEPPPSAAGVAAVDAFNPPSTAARRALVESSRIEVPGRHFVLWVVAGYLAVLVPLNGLVFRLLGRTEWAWAAVPLIALGGAFVVIRAAQLDIGFARLATEIAVVEIQGDRPRAHVTRYTALYTSLATRYRFTWDERNTIFHPFPRRDAADLASAPLRSPTTLHYRFGERTGMQGLPVASNTTGMVHSEQFLALEGPLSLWRLPTGGYEIANETGLAIGPGVLVERTAQGGLRLAALTGIETGATVTARPQPADAAKSLFPALCAEGAAAPPGLIPLLRPLLDLATTQPPLAPGDVRLVALSAAEMGGVQIHPAAPQSRRVTVVVAHLRYGMNHLPLSDENAYREPAFVDP